MSTIKVTNIEHASTANGGIQLDNAGHVTVDGQQLPTAGALSNRNLIINGAMQVAQRATTSTSTSGGYRTVDRFSYRRSGYTPNLTISQETDSPDGFANSVKILVSTAATVGVDDYSEWRTNLEAQNLQHLSYGSASAKALTLSFYVKSNVTGTYSVALTQDDSSRRQSATYTVSSSGTWEYNTVTIAGDASGTINNDNGSGLALRWALSAGSDYTTGSNGTWATTTANHYAGHAVDLTGTNSNYWQITGIQLEVGEKATPFEHRSYGDELARCQRYFNMLADSGYEPILNMACYTTTAAYGVITFPVAMRTSPSMYEQNVANGIRFLTKGVATTNLNGNILTIDRVSEKSIRLQITSGLSVTAGDAGWVELNNQGAKVGLDAEL